ncbi:reverse transcriptase domain-containing protein [Tanacetum coccineum]
MKLNPKKCSFGVEEGPFLGHLITKQGIKANPSKIKAVTNLDQPRILKDIQSLNGKLAALIRFSSEGVERSLAIFKVHKGCKDKKNIQWTTEADKALEKIKKIVQALPTLTAPREVPDSNSKWRLYTDGASNSDGSGVGLMLIDPEGKEYTYALRFEFEITNNEAEYEALLIKGTFVAKQTSIKDYLQKVKTALRGFEETRRTKQADISDLRISHKGSVSRSFNQKVNRGKRSFEGRYTGEEKLDGPQP